MHQQLWGYKVEWKNVSRGTGGKKVEYHCSKQWSDRRIGGLVGPNSSLHWLLMIHKNTM
jgi:hypothetical protein